MNNIFVLPKQQGIRAWALAAVMVIGGSLALAVSAKTQVPFYPVPMTLQTLVLALLCLSYRPGLGLATVLLYLAEGAAGLPVFAGASAGPAYFVGPTAGYLIGSVPAAMLLGYGQTRQWHLHGLKCFALIVGAFALIYACGYIWLSVLIGYERAFALGVQPFVLGDLAKALLAVLSIRIATRILARRAA